METLELALTEFSRRSGSVLVSHRATRLARGLEPGERVLVDDAGEVRTAVVADLDFDLDDTRYRLVLGPVVLPAGVAPERLSALYDAVLGATPQVVPLSAARRGTHAVR